MRKSEEKMRKVVLITGSSRGIGRAEALRFSADGYAVAVNYIEREDKAEEVVALICQQGNDAFAYQADVSDFEAVRNMVSKVEKDLGPVEVLVNNAGIARMSQFQDITPELWQRMFAVNLNGAFNTIQAVLPHMLHVHAGVIVNTSSIWGEHGASCEVAYSSTKHAIIGLTKSLAMELAPTGIRVNCVAPGVVDTDMVQVLGKDTLQMLEKETPLGRLGKPADIAALVEFLASEEASYITGQVITCDGGFKNV